MEISNIRLPEKTVVPALSNSISGILTHFSLSQTLPACVIKRSKIVLLSAEGKLNEEIARECDMHINNVEKWRMRFINELNRLLSVEHDDQGKLELELTTVLRDKQRTGTKQTFSADQRTFIVTVVCQDPKDHGYELSHRSLSALRRAIIDKRIVPSISVASISRILDENEVHPHKNQYWLHSVEKTDAPEVYKEKVAL